MFRYLLRRLLGAFFVVVGITTFSFFMIRIAPGGPFDSEKMPPPEIMRNLEKKYHLDEPLMLQYARYAKDVLVHFDFGPSFRYPERSVNEFIDLGFPVTLRLAIYSMIIAVLIGISSGLIAALYQNSRWDYSAMAFAMLGVSIPDFVLGPLFQLIFGLKLHWLPIAGWDGANFYVLPSLTLGSMYAASIARLTRGGMLEITRQDFIRTARAKGLSERVVILRHMLKGGLLPVVTYLGPAAAFMMGGSMVVEKIFDVPGLGRHFVNSALNRDYTMTLGLTIFFSAIIVLFNLIVDIAYTFLDPRVKYE
ncbi:MAG: ABC transporter permease subunit [Deltaproteobacteria bacterium]|nr:ABC transporter permease subunit [Deltaproteobacteria bacterium]